MKNMRFTVALLGGFALCSNAPSFGAAQMSTRDAARFAKQLALVGSVFNDITAGVHTLVSGTDQLHKDSSFGLADTRVPRLGGDIQEGSKHVYNVLKSALGEEDAAATIMTWAKTVTVPVQGSGWTKETAKRVALDLVFEVLKDGSKRATKPLVDAGIKGQTNTALVRTTKASTKLVTQALLSALKVWIEEYFALIAKDCGWDKVEKDHKLERWAKGMVEPVVTTVAYEILGEAVSQAIKAADAPTVN